MQETLNWLSQWCDKNFMSINASRIVEIRIDFGRTKTQVPQLQLHDSVIEIAQSAKLLGVIISQDLKWDKHADHIHTKVSQRLHYLRTLRRSGLTQVQLRQVYTTLIRPVLEYACPVWSTGLSDESKELLETIQKRACRIIAPGFSYSAALQQTGLEPLHVRRTQLCQKLFVDMQNTTHKLHSMLPPIKECHYNIRNSKKYRLPKCKTNRTKNSFLPWCLFKFQ